MGERTDGAHLRRSLAERSMGPISPAQHAAETMILRSVRKEWAVLAIATLLHDAAVDVGRCGITLTDIRCEAWLSPRARLLLLVKNEFF